MRLALSEVSSISFTLQLNIHGTGRDHRVHVQVSREVTTVPLIDLQYTLKIIIESYFIFSMNVSKHSMSESSDTASEQPPEKLKRNEELPCTNECYYQKTFAVLNVMRKCVSSKRIYISNATFLSTLKPCRKNLFCDVVLVTNDIEIPAHRVILAACSSYFHAIFSRIETNRIEVKEIGWPALESLIEYIYTAEILVTKKNVRVITNFLFPHPSLWNILTRMFVADVTSCRQFVTVLCCQKCVLRFFRASTESHELSEY